MDVSMEGTPPPPSQALEPAAERVEHSQPSTSFAPEPPQTIVREPTPTQEEPQAPAQAPAPITLAHLPAPVLHATSSSTVGVPVAPVSVPGTPSGGDYVTEPATLTTGIPTSNVSQADSSPGGGARPLNVKDALSYLELVKYKFVDMPDVYNHFLDIMKDFKSQAINTPGVIERVSNLFSGHPTLIQGFNTFLPAGYRIDCSSTATGGTTVTVTTPSGTTTTTAGGNINNLSRIESGAPTLPPISGIPWASTSAPLTGGSAVNAPEPLYPYAPLPGPMVSSNPAAPEFNHAIQFVNKIKQHFSHSPETYKQFLEVLQKYQLHQRPYQEVYVQVSNLFKGAPELIDEFKDFLPDPSGGKSSNGLYDMLNSAGHVHITTNKDQERKDKTKAFPQHPEKTAKRKKRALEETVAPAKPQQQPKPKRPKHHRSNKNEPQSPPYAHAPSPVSHQNGGHQYPTNGTGSQATATTDESLFFERVRKFFDDKAVFADFLKLLNMFTQEIIDARTLVERATSFLGETELLQQFKDIIGWDDRNIVVEPESGLKGNSTVVAALDRPKVDLNSCKKYGPSYRKLPKEEVHLACSGRDAMCWEVLNDEWVSHPTWASEDAGFQMHKKNQYEEALHKSEEERHEYDFHVEAITRTIQVLEPILMRISGLEGEERMQFRLKPGLGGQGKSIYQRIIKKVYGKEHGQEVINALHESPCIAVPVVLQRLRQKDDEWKRAQREWNKVWREVDGRNYYRSLDHQGVNFKANDKKTYGPKQLVTDIEAKRKEHAVVRVKDIDVLDNRTRSKDHYAFKMDDPAVLQDCVKLFLIFIDRTNTATYPRSDKIQYENFLRSFVSTFFMLDQTRFDASLVEPIAIKNSSPGTAAPHQLETAESDDAASDIMSQLDEGEDGTTSRGSKTGIKKGNGATGGIVSADLRKRLLKSGARKAASSSQPPSRASPTPGAIADSPGDAFSTPEGEAWVKYKTTDQNVQESAAFKPLAKDGGGRKSNFFANNNTFVLLRQFQILYQRLHMCKTISNELATDDSGWHLANPIALDLGLHDTSGPGQSRLLNDGTNPAKRFYEWTLSCCEQLFDGSMDQSLFEDNLRFMFDIKAYIMYTIDKLLATIVKQVQVAVTDTKTQHLVTLLHRERAMESTTAQQLINYRRDAEAIVVDDNLYRICWIVPTNIMQIQLLGQEDISNDDPVTLTEKWRQYIESYTLPHQTEGFPVEVKPPFLRRALEESQDESQPPSYLSRARLQIKICIRSYRLFFISGTEDLFWRLRTPAETEDTRNAAAKRRSERKSALNSWLESRITRELSGTQKLEDTKPLKDVEMKESTATATATTT